MPPKFVIAALLALGAAAPADAAMSVNAFLARAAPLRANPLMAMMSPDYPLLKEEAANAAHQLKAERAARQAAGKRPIACLPEGQSMGIMDMLAGLDTLSPAEKKLPLKDGYARVLAKRYPC